MATRDLQAETSKAPPFISEESLILLEEWEKINGDRIIESVLWAQRLVLEANMLAEAMSKETVFEVVLTVPPSLLTPQFSSKEMNTSNEVVIRVLYKEQGVDSVWNIKTLEEKILAMREMYEQVEEGASFKDLNEPDPFGCEEPGQHKLLGMAHFSLECLLHGIAHEYTAPIVSPTGNVNGKLKVVIESVPTATSEYRSDEIMDDSPLGDTISCQIIVIEATELPNEYCHYVFCQYQFWNQVDPMIIPPLVPSGQAKPWNKLCQFHHKQVFRVEINDTFWSFIKDGTFSVEVWGSQGPSVFPEYDLDTKRQIPFVERWGELTQLLELWIEIMELNDQGEYVPVEIKNKPNVKTGGVYMIQPGQVRQIHAAVYTVRGSGNNPLKCDHITSVSIGSFYLHNRYNEPLDSFQSHDLERLQTKWSDLLVQRREYLEREVRKVMDKREPNVARENELLDQWAMLQWQRAAVISPKPNSGVPGAPTEFRPAVPGLEFRSTVLFLDLNNDFLTLCDDNPAGPLSGEKRETMINLPIDEHTRGTAVTTSWDSSLHGLSCLNKVTVNDDRVYGIIKVGVALAHPPGIVLELRKRICLQVHKKNIFGTFVRALTAAKDAHTASGVRYEVVMGVPKLKGMDPPSKIPPNPIAIELSEDENAVEKFKFALASINNILSLDQLKQKASLRERLIMKEQEDVQKIMPKDDKDHEVVQKPFSICIQPEDVICKTGNAVKFSLETTPKAYSICQWYFNDQPIRADSNDYSGQLTNHLLIEKCFPKYKGVYHCLAEDRFGTQVISRKATLTTDGEMIAQQELLFIGKILKTSGIDFASYGIMTNDLVSGNVIGITYEEMEFLMSENPRTLSLSLNLRQEIKSRLEENQLYDQAMKNDSRVSLCYTKILAIGPGQVGKSTFIRRLLGIMKGNIQTSLPETLPPCSTGISEMREACIQYLRVSGALTFEKKWHVFAQEFELQSQLRGLMRLVTEQTQHEHIDIKPAANKTPVPSSETLEVTIPAKQPELPIESVQMETAQNFSAVEEIKSFSTPAPAPIVPLKADIHKTINDFEVLKVLLPAVLQTADTELISRKPTSETEELLPEPICIRFKTGYLPLGFVCALSANLIAENNFQLLMDETNTVFKNAICFRFKGKFNINMISCPRYCEFRVTRHSGDADFWGDDCCPLITKTLIRAASKVIRTMQHGSTVVARESTGCMLAFHCSEHKSSEFGQEPLAEVLTLNQNTQQLPLEAKCTTCNTAISLTPEMSLWFGKAPSIQLKITKQPTLKENLLTVTAEGARPLKYQWLKGKRKLSDSENFGGCETSQLVIKNSQLLTEGVYKCQIVDKYEVNLESESIDLFDEALECRGLPDEDISKLKEIGFRSLDDVITTGIDEIPGLNLGEKQRIKRLLFPQEPTELQSVQPQPVTSSPELEKLMIGFGLTSFDIKQECSDNHITEISDELTDWEFVAIRLKLTGPQIAAIKEEHSRVELRRFYALSKWKSAGLLTGTATYRVLLEALLKCKCNELAMKVCRLLRP